MKQYLFFALATFLFVACGSNSQKSIEYVKQTSNDKTYSIDVPKSASRNQCVSSLMSFINEQSHLFIVVDKTNMTPSEYDASQKQDHSFTRTVMEDNDSILIVKSTRGTMNAWSAYNCIGKTEIDGTGCWWLRTNSIKCEFVIGSGTVFTSRNDVNLTDICVRPAMWISLE